MGLGLQGEVVDSKYIYVSISATKDIKSGNLPLKSISRASADEILCFSHVDK
jgi:hypothetical protein